MNFWPPPKQEPIYLIDQEGLHRRLIWVNCFDSAAEAKLHDAVLKSNPDIQIVAEHSVRLEFVGYSPDDGIPMMIFPDSETREEGDLP